MRNFIYVYRYPLLLILLLAVFTAGLCIGMSIGHRLSEKQHTSAQ